MFFKLYFGPNYSPTRVRHPKCGKGDDIDKAKFICLVVPLIGAICPNMAPLALQLGPLDVY